MPSRKLSFNLDLIKKLAILQRWPQAVKFISIIIPLIFAGTICAALIIFSSPLVVKLVQYRQAIHDLDIRIAEYKNRLDEAKKLNREQLEKKIVLLKRKMSPDYSMSFILNNLTELGSNFGVIFNSINPGSAAYAQENIGRVTYHMNILPIEVHVQSEYENFAVFMNSLSELSNCLILIKGYNLYRDESILPRLSAKLNLEAWTLRNITQKSETNEKQ